MLNQQVKAGGFLEHFRRDLEEIGEKGVSEILELGRRWNIAEELKNGGSAIFPHACPVGCGDQVATVVQGCLNSGTDRVLVLGVYHHRRKKELLEAWQKEYEGIDISNEVSWGIFDQIDEEYSLLLFKVLWDAEVKRRGIRAPHLILRYPNLVNRCPEKLLGIEELIRISKDSVVVATADLCHHGIAYATPNSQLLDMSEKGEEYAREAISRALNILECGNYRDFYNACIDCKSDGKDTLSVLRYLKGKQHATILDLRLLDTSIYYEGDLKPSWVAAALITLSAGIENDSEPIAQYCMA